MTSMTNGWDAICALELSAVNFLLLQQYISNNAPGSPGTPLQFATQQPAFTGMWLASVVISPPELSFAADAGQQAASLSVTVQSASLVSLFSQTSGLAIWPPLDGVPVQCTVQLQAVDGGIDTLGQVVATFNGSQAPPMGATPMAAIVSGIQSQPMTYTLGTILDANSGPGLQPTSFEFGIQNSSDGARSALMLMITTSGQPGTAPPLPQYPLPAGSTAGLIIGANAMFSSVLPGAIEPGFFNIADLPPSVPIQFNAQQNVASQWSIVATGVANFGKLLSVDTSFGPSMFTADPSEPAFPANCQVPLADSGASFIVVVAGDGTLHINWNASWSQGWYCTFPLSSGFYSPDNTMLFTYANVLTPSMDPVTGIVAFAGQGTSTFGFGSEGVPPPPGSLLPLFQPPVQLYQLTETGPNEQLFNPSFFPGVSIASVNTFALQNLLFPEQNVLSLTSFTFPGDLVLSGNLKAMVTVSPAAAIVAAGAHQQFTASESDVLWECHTGGHIEAGSGLYTAPISFGVTHIDTISARDRQNRTTSVPVTVLPSVQTSAITVSPASALLAGTHTLDITITDASGALVEATCTLGIGDVGNLSRVSLGVWNYQPLQSATTATVSATSAADPTQIGTTAITVVATTDTITLTWGDGTLGWQVKALSPGQTIEISAVAQSGYTNFSWAIFPGPGDGGSLVPSATDPTRATFTAPASIVIGVVNSVCAYYADKSVPALGVGSALFYYP